jgi:glycosyltransferase involved in cell wall biosynthesis
MIDKRFSKNPPLISIITVTYNCLHDLAETFNSVISQSYKNIEYIVIDGGSEDGTMGFLHEHDDEIAYWVSEKDSGIYDAMNKGALASTGDWLIFMNSGDKFLTENTLNQVISYLNDTVDVVYGGVESITNDRFGYHTDQRHPYDLSIIWREIPTCHQSIFVRRELQLKFPFNIDLSWCADHDFITRLYVSGYKFLEIPVVVAKFDTSGGASRDLLSFTRERWSIYRKHFSRSFAKDWYFINEYKGFWLHKNIISKVRDLLPSGWVLTWRKYRGIY